MAETVAPAAQAGEDRKADSAAPAVGRAGALTAPAARAAMEDAAAMAAAAGAERVDLRSPSTVPIPRSHPMAMSPQAADRPAQAEWADLLRQPASRLLAILARTACPACWPRWLVVRIPRLLASLRATLHRASDPRHSPAMPTSHRPAATVWST